MAKLAMKKLSCTFWLKATFSAPLPDLDRWVKPIPTEGRVGTDYARHITTCPLGFSYFAYALRSHLVLWCQHATIIRVLPVFHWIRKWVLRTATGEKKINYHGRFLLAWLQHYTSAKLCQYAQNHYFLMWLITF